MGDPATASANQLHPEARTGDRSRRDTERALVTAAFRSALQGRAKNPTPTEPPTISHDELPVPRPQSPVAREWDFYRREVAKLLADGQEGRFVLIKREAVVGIWDAEADSEAAALQRFPAEPCLIHQIRRREPLLRLSPRLQGWLG